MTWQFWTAIVALSILLICTIRREREHRRRFSEYVAHLDWLQEQYEKNADIVVRKSHEEQTHGNRRHFFGIVEGLGIARKDACRFLRRDW